MRSIVILGAGRSSSSLISYLLDFAARSGRKLIVGDASEHAAAERVGHHKAGEAVAFDIEDAERSRAMIKAADVVVSLLPAHLHHLVARLCLDHHAHLLTASYVSDEIRSLDREARDKSLLLLNECGLDPGIDHMTAMQVIERIQDAGGKMHSFESFTGGLIAPETDPGNPWRYKFTWNARNVVMAGQGVAKFKKDGSLWSLPYQRLFKETTPVTVPGCGSFEGYANRDSLRYIETYGLEGILTMLRGTLRPEGFCSAWNILVQLGCCDDTREMESVDTMTHVEYLQCFLEGAGRAEEKIAAQFGIAMDSTEMRKLRWSGLFDDEKVGLSGGTPATILEHILNKKWKLAADDRDMIVMWHKFGFHLNGANKTIESSLAVTGADSVNTAMARTVGLPLGIAVRLLLEGRIRQRGVVIPTSREIYEPVLAELREHGVEMKEYHK